ncbi:MAG: hypothetical protein RQ745_12625 [Longimicrobiales bacterium]|nr:hypothetical protein [Longimicrobiales bacterium]
MVRWTLGSAALWGGLFLGVTALRAASAGVSFLEVVGPLLALGLIGATVGGLTGPLARAIWLHSRGPGA